MSFSGRGTEEGDAVVPADGTATLSADGGTSSTPPTVFRVPAGGDIQSFIDLAKPGDIVEVEPGVYEQRLKVVKKITLRSRIPWGAVLVGTASPPLDVDEGQAAAAMVGVYVVDAQADGFRLEGFTFRYFVQGVRVMRVADAVITGNRFESSYGNGIVLKDTSRIEIAHNDFSDPYLPNESPLGTVVTDGETDAQMDYGVSIYGSIDTFLHHNTFFGVFNQALSFKYANLNGRVEDNTFEGCTLTALFFGQEVSGSEQYPRFGRSGNDTGNFRAVRNLFRNVKAQYQGAMVEYRARTPIRVWNIDQAASVEVANNLVQSALEGVRVECQAAIQGCAHGKVSIHHNVLNGNVVDTSGRLRTIGVYGVWVTEGVQATVLVDHNTVAHWKTGIETSSAAVEVTNNVLFENTAGLKGTARVAAYNTFFRSGTAAGTFSRTADPLLVGPLRYDIASAERSQTPNLSFACPFSLSASSPDRATDSAGSFRGALPVRGACP